ncbi:hypothetical protein K439DRAFT_1617098 [Ramaria rubella]|nr:hypothetical protein K439DRAFT_1617098 [Ramaria rubella]
MDDNCNILNDTDEDVDTANKVTRCRYCREIKELVVYQQNMLGLKTAEIALNLNMSLHIVQRVLQLYKELRDVMKDPHMYQRHGPSLVLNPTACDMSCTFIIYGKDLPSYAQYMLKLLEEKPDLYLDEITLELNDVTSLDISISTVHRSLKLLGITSKRVSLMSFYKQVDVLITPQAFKNHP